MANFDRLCPGCMKDNAGQGICSICGYDASKGNAPDKLPVKFIIRDRYFVGKTIFSNSESTIYLGFDGIENKAVSIKEYFPAGIAGRNPDKTVFVPREAQLAFNEGLLEFIDINKKLKDFPLQSLPATYSVFEENSTAYAICDVISGITLKSFLSRNGGHLRWEQVRPLVLPLIDTVKSLHEISLIHGDISPDTVMVCKDGKLRMFGVPISGIKSLKGNGDFTHVPSFHDGYAAAEQYGAVHENIGEYTDVYGICATLLTMITGIVPPSANLRLKGDTLKIPVHFADELPRQVLVSLANGMQVKPADRTGNIETLKNELIYGETKENIRKTRRAAEMKNADTKAALPQEEKKSSSLKYAAVALGITVGIMAIIGIILLFTVFRSSILGLFKKTDESANNPSMPSQQQIGDYDSDLAESKMLYTVPELRGKYYVEIENLKELDHFEVVIKGKEYSSNYERGQICEQSVSAGDSKEHGTVIQVTISLGTQQVRMPRVTGLTKEQAQIELLKIGLLYKNIEITPKYDANAAPDMVIGQYPDQGKAISPESAVRVYVNSYTGDDKNSSGSDADVDDIG